MRNDTLRNSEHLLRLLAVVALAVGLFLVLRNFVIPPDFGILGHYRAGALLDNQNRNVVHAGQAECALCHDDQVKIRSEGKHAGIACESCHGPLANHAADPEVKPPKLEVTALCTGCHQRDPAKPKWFPQVVVKTHSEGMDCNTCHQPHKPKI